MVKERPLSPHLQVYKPQITSMVSILHRACGVFLAIGTPLLVCWIGAIAAGPEAYAQAQACASHWLAQLVLLGWTFAMLLHLCNGVRHLFWDIGKGFEIESVNKSGWFVLAISILGTAVLWYCALAGGHS